MEAKEKGPAILHIVDKGNPRSWMFMPGAMARIEAFCLRYGGDGTPEDWRRFLETQFTAENPDMFLLLVMDGIEIVGHVLAIMCNWLGKPFCLICQLQIDRPLDGELVDAGFDAVRAWAVRRKAKRIKVETVSRAHLRAFRKHGLRFKRFTAEMGV